MAVNFIFEVGEINFIGMRKKQIWNKNDWEYVNFEFNYFIENQRKAIRFLNYLLGGTESVTFWDVGKIESQKSTIDGYSF